MKIVDQMNDILKRECPRLRAKVVDVRACKHYDDELFFYMDKGKNLIVTLFKPHNGKTYIRSILRRTEALKATWLINGQSSTGTKLLKFYGERTTGPEIDMEDS